MAHFINAGKTKHAVGYFILSNAGSVSSSSSSSGGGGGGGQRAGDDIKMTEKNDGV